MRVAGDSAYRSNTYSSDGILPDFTADPRLVLDEMRKREDWTAFKEHLDYILEGDEEMFDLILDQTGKLCDLASEWMEGRRK